MLAGIVGCAVAQTMGTTVPYAVYGITLSAIVLLAFALFTPGRPAKSTPREMVRNT